MNISGISSYMDSIASLATGLKGQEVSMELSVAILKQLMDQQKMMMEAINNMIAQSPSPDVNVGQNIDISA